MTENSQSDKSSKTILALHNIHKSFGGIHALAGVSFDLREGEIHALAGENGAGKSTLIKVITGAYTPDQGEIEIGGKKYHGLNPELSRHLGVGVVYQEFNILPEISVAENIFLAAQPLNWLGLIDIKTRGKQAAKILERLGASQINPNMLVKNLTVGEQQIVEIAKALATNARVLIMDEPSAVLPSRDLDRLFTVIRTLCSEGVGIIYISHRLNEIFELADRVTILKDGQTMATKNIDETDNADLVRLMVGRSLTDMYSVPDDTQPGEVILDVQGLCVEGNVYDINFNVREGEVVGLAGLGGSGRTTVCRSLVGLGTVECGHVTYLGKPAPRDPATAAKAGLVLVPEDRKAFGLVLNQSMRFNISLPNLFQFNKFGILQGNMERQSVKNIISNLQIRPDAPEVTAENLSGGNQQKIVIGKWLLTNPKLVVFDEPTRGIDVGAKSEIYMRIRELSRRGVGVLMASSELPELIGMCDRILVFHEGKIVGEVQRADFSDEAIMHLATATALDGVV